MFMHTEKINCVIVEVAPDKYGLLSIPHQEESNFSALFSPAHKIRNDEDVTE